MSLHNKIFFSFFIVALIPFYILFYYLYENNYEMIMKKNDFIQEKKFNEKVILIGKDLKELEREIEFLASLYVMDDIVSDDLDKRILGVIHLKKKVFKLLSDISVKGINEECIASTNGCKKEDDSLVYKKKIFASFDRNKELGSIELILPYNSLLYYFQEDINIWSFTNEFTDSAYLKSDVGYGLNLFMLVNKKKLAKSFSLLQTQLTGMALLSLITFLLLFLFISKVIAKPIAENLTLQEERLHLQSSQLILLEKAKHLAQTKAHFISQMSHEFRTPLNSIIGFSQFLEQEKLVDEEYKKLPVNIEKAGKHLLGMVNQILEYAKVQSEHLQLEIQKINIQELLQEVHDIVLPLSQKKGLNLSLESQDIYIFSDKKMLTNILFNLLGNAIKFTSQGFVKMTALQVEEIVEISIYDSGIGMNKEESKTLFEPFSRLDNAQKIEGTGLGLALCKSYSQLLNAEIVYEHQEVGSKFTLRLKEVI